MRGPTSAKNSIEGVQCASRSASWQRRWDSPRTWRRLWKIPMLAVGLLLLSVWARSSDLSLSGRFGSTSGGRANLDLPYNAGSSLGETDEDAPERVHFYGQSYETDSIVFCLDESLSMRHSSRWEIQKREATKAITEMTDKAWFGIVFYGKGSHAFTERLVRANAANKQRAIAYVQGREMSLGTCLEKGVLESLRLLKNASGKNPTVIVAGDGRPTSCPFRRGSHVNDVALIRRTVAANPGRRVRVFTIFVGTDTAHEATGFMESLATAHGGTSRIASR